MTTPTNPFEIARETLRLLAARRTPPTPDNYLTLYHEISGTRPTLSQFPEKQLRTLAASLPRSSPDQLRLARLLDEAVKHENWDDYRSALADFVSSLVESQKLTWGSLISDLLTQWEMKHPGLTTARKREALDHILSSAGNNPDNLYTRLQNLMRAWGDGKLEARNTEDEAEMASAPAATAGTTPASLSRESSLLPELRELMAFTLETAISTQLIEAPALSEEARALAGDIRRANDSAALKDFLTRLKRFAFKLELLAEDQAELRHSLLGLLRLMVENATELVLDDQWLHGQIAVVRDIIDQPLSQRGLDDAERRLKEVIFKQSQLKQSLQESKAYLQRMLAGFVDHLADFADATSDYHDKIGACAGRISSAKDITELGSVLTDVMRAMESIQENAQKSRDDLRSTQSKVKESEARIRELENELASTSKLVRYDQLTGVLNRRGLEEMFEKESARATRHESPLCVGLLDIDNFKKLNDSLGHHAGDQALIHLAGVCREALRPQDTVARYGGEEFILLLPDASLDEAAQVLTRLQRELTKRFFMHDNEKVLITFSAGVTELRPEDNQSSVIKRADEAMYQAKQSGKNRVCTAA